MNLQALDDKGDFWAGGKVHANGGDDHPACGTRVHTELGYDDWDARSRTEAKVTCLRCLAGYQRRTA